ncbi:MAG: YegP family protein [Pseudomonadota bacterium]
MYYYVYIDVARQWRWTLYAANGRKIANSGEGYFNKQDCLHGLDLTASSRGLPVKYAA